MILGFGNLGGVIAGFSFRPHDAPRYFAGHGLLIGTVSMSLVLCIIMNIYLVRENKRRDAEMAAKGYTLDSYTEDMKVAERERGDYATVSILVLCISHCNFESTLISTLQFFRYTV